MSLARLILRVFPAPLVLLCACLTFEPGRCEQEDAQGYCTPNDGESCTAGANVPEHRERVTCPELSGYGNRPDAEPQRWQQVPDRDVLVYSAFMEWREESEGPSVRIIAAGLQEDYNRVGGLYCLLWYDAVDGDGAECVSQLARYVRIYPSTLHPDMWVSHFVLCPLEWQHRSEPVPNAVSVTPRPCAAPSNLLVVGNRRRPSSETKGVSHGLCLPPIYNRFSDWRMLVEMFELHRLLGVAEIVVYNQSMSAEVSRLLELYASDGTVAGALRVNVVQWHFPSARLRNNVNCQRAAINDCAYRLSSRHRFVAVTDLDEVIVPRRTFSWPKMMEALATRGRGVYMFQHVYYRRNDTGQKPYLITQQSLWRTDRVTPAGKIRCKSIYDTDLLLSLDLHYHYELLPGAVEYLVPPDVAMLHHYRATPMSSFLANPDKYTYIEDTYMHLFGDELIKRFNAVVARMSVE